MSHGKTAFMLMAALALPRAAGALGLGEIHVESALNEPLAAEIDIVGATAEDLSGITAAIANRDIFLRFGVERPAFLSTATFKIVRDSRGRAVLAVRSTEAFTEPLVGMLVDLRWRGGEMIRQYTLLLDPPGFAPAAHVAELAPAADAPATVAPPVSEPPVAGSKAPVQTVPQPGRPKSSARQAVAPKTVKVSARTTLRAVARRVGARGDSELTRMMIALFRANPNAFEGNINRLRRGAVLSIPSAAEVSAIPMAEAHREFRVQMEAWRGTAQVASRAKPVTPAVATPVPASGEGAVPAEPAAAASSPDTEAALGRRIQTLEKGLSALQDLLDRERDQLVRVQATVLHEEKAAAATDTAPRTTAWQTFGRPVAAALALLVGAFGAFHAWRRRRRAAPRPAMPPADINARGNSETFESDAPRAVAHSAEREEVKPVLAAPTVLAVSTAPPTPTIPAAPEEPRRDMLTEATTAALAVQVLEGIDVASLEASYLLESSGDGTETTTLASAAAGICADDPNAETMPVETIRTAAGSEPAASKASGLDRTIAMDGATAETTKLDYDLLDLDATAHHVQMPSQLHENVGFKERRTSLVDALKLAIEREPNRRDLRMKLLETYYAAAATNRQGFLELVRKLAGEREKASGEEWDKIVRMGRQIASDNDLFASEAADEDDQDLANCA
jgi:pilus assembly protein FimV